MRSALAAAAQQLGLRPVAHARANAGSKPSELWDIEQRALESAEYARTQFVKAPGKVIARGKNWLLKETG